MMDKVMGKKRILLKAILIVLYAVVFAEFFLRIFQPVPILPRYINAAYYGIRGNQANKTYIHKSSEYKIEIRTNDKGIRSDYDIPYKKPEGVKRIVVLGDSFAMGYGVNLENTFTVIMREKIEENTGERYELINLATSGHGNAEELIVLQNEGIKYSPDIVLLCWHRTDFKDNIRSNLFVMEDGVLKRAKKIYLPGVEARERLFSIPGFEFIVTKSELYNKTRDSLGIYIKKFMVASREESKHSETNEKEEISYSTELCINLISEINKTAEDAGAKLIILDIPDKTSRISFVSRIPDLKEWKKTENIPVFSPIVDMKEKASPDVKLYWEKSQGHFTPLGCEIVGKGLGKFIANDIQNK